MPFTTSSNVTSEFHEFASDERARKTDELIDLLKMSALLAAASVALYAAGFVDIKDAPQKDRTHLVLRK